MRLVFHLTTGEKITGEMLRHSHATLTVKTNCGESVIINADHVVYVTILEGKE